MSDDHINYWDKLHASVVKHLYDGGYKELATDLLQCDIDGHMDEDERVFITLYGSITFLEKYTNHLEQLGEEKIWQVFNALESGIYHIGIKLRKIEVDDQWKERIEDILRGEKTSNQGTASANSPYRRSWNGLLFGSNSELKIAQELDRRGILYFPGCKARVGSPENRRNYEPDFLIFHQGRWGILEVSGDKYHTAQNAPQDHERVRNFKKHGITVDHYDATKCWENPAEVVSDFLQVLAGLKT